MPPEVSVVMAVYNGERYLREAIDSVLSQSFSNFEFVIVDDGSTDGTAAVLGAVNDHRVQVIRNGKNRGLADSLNTGFRAAAGRFIARMDADDFCKPERLARQVGFMQARQEIGIVGSWVEVVGMGRHEVVEYAVEPDVICARLLFESALSHPSVMIRREWWGQAGLSYDASFTCAQDYDVWVRAAEEFPLANQPEVLLTHRLHPDQIGRRSVDVQLAYADQVRRRQLQQLGVEIDEESFAVHRALGTWSWAPTGQFAEQAEVWLRRLEQANRRVARFPEPAFSRVLGERWLAVCRSVESDPSTLFWGSPLSGAVGFDWKDKWRGRLKRGLAALGGVSRGRA